MWKHIRVSMKCYTWVGRWVELEACLGFSVNAAFHLVELNRKENKGSVGFHASRAVFIKGYTERALR